MYVAFKKTEKKGEYGRQHHVCAGQL